jgi:cytochrome oxidase Cu insertion factor (SCO1/SenC/PrrC family)
MLRALATAGILALLAFTVALPHLSMFGRGTEAAVRADIVAAVIDGDDLGRPMPDFSVRELDGAPFRLADLRGKRVLITFERSLDW